MLIALTISGFACAATASQDPARRSAWRCTARKCSCGQRLGVVCHAGYILRFPADTPQTIAEDVETLKGIGFDLVSFFVLTPLPGSEDHIRQYVAGIPMDEDLNNYDSFQPVLGHPLMSRKQWQEAYDRAWRQFYTPRHMTAALRRIPKDHYWGMFRNFLWYRWSAVACATTEVVYALRFSTVVLVQLLRQS